MLASVSKLVRVTCLLILLIGQTLLFCGFCEPVNALDVEGMVKDGLKNQLPKAVQQEPIKVERKTQKLEDLIPRQDIPYSFPPMIPLQGITIKGLGPKAVLSLGENYFVVRSNSGVTSMDDLYRQNRQAGKANFVTVDCVLHPYFAFCNRVNASTIKRYLLPQMKALLSSMLRIAISDYKQADDAEVRTDVECNIAFLSLALKLMEPEFAIPALGRVPQMVQADYDSVVFAKPGKSVIYDRNEDFTCYKPQGWFRSSPELTTFFRVKTWLSRLSYPINDVTFEADGIKVNNFRRSVLLYRCLDLARVDGKPAFDAWTKVIKGMFLLGSQVENWQDRNLYAHDYKSVFKINGPNSELKGTLQALAEPLYRTKLLLAVRKQKPLSLGSTSIFDLEETHKGKESIAAFRFMPIIGSPEDPWLAYAANLYPKPGLSTNVFPVGLLDLNAWGAPQAANFLLDSSWAMDDSMPKTISELKRWVLRRGIGGQVQPVDSRIWGLLTPAWRLLPEGIQTALRGEMWANRRLETILCAWLDSQLAIAPANYMNKGPQSGSDAASGDRELSGDEGVENAMDKIPLTEAKPKTATASPSRATSSPPAKTMATNNAAATSVINKPGATTVPATRNNLSNSQSLNSRLALSTNKTVPEKTGAGNATLTAAASANAVAASPGPKPMKPAMQRRAARGHFLDPCPDVYNRLLADTQRIDKDLTALGFPLDPNLKRGLDDYTRLFTRLFKIAKDECEGRTPIAEDLNLLGNIDLILDKIDVPLPAVMPVYPPAKFDASAADDKGFTMSLGRPGILYIILMNKNTKEWTLARGAVYTYYESYGTSMSEEELLSKIDAGTIPVPYWTERFDLLQADRK